MWKIIKCFKRYWVHKIITSANVTYGVSVQLQAPSVETLLVENLHCVDDRSKTLEFFLNRAELSLNSANLKINEAWIGLNLKILSPHVSCWCCGSILVSHTRGSCMAGSSPFIVMTNIFVTEFSEFSETCRKNSITTYKFASNIRNFSN